MTQNLSFVASGARRLTVSWIMLCLPFSANTCLGMAFRLRGQKRVPLPPARMTGKKSIFLDLVLREGLGAAGFGFDRVTSAMRRCRETNGARLSMGFFLANHSPAAKCSLQSGLWRRHRTSRQHGAHTFQRPLRADAVLPHAGRQHHGL